MKSVRIPAGKRADYAFDHATLSSRSVRVRLGDGSVELRFGHDDDACVVAWWEAYAARS